MSKLRDLAPHIIQLYQDFYSQSDTANERFQLDLSTPFGSFCAVAQGIMYAFPIYPRYAEDTIAAILEHPHCRDWFSVPVLSDNFRLIASHPYRDGLRLAKSAAPLLFKLVEENYKRIPNLITYNILKAAHLVAKDAESDFSKLYYLCEHDGKGTLTTIMEWNVRLRIKAFWIAREMRIQRVWKNNAEELIGGEFCCVVDVQVERALKCLGVFDERADLFELSRQIWDAFGDYYDLPLLWLAREYCSKKKALLCPLASCGLCRKQN